MPRISNEQKLDFPLILEAHVCQLKFNVNYYCSPTRIPNRDKKTEWPYLLHPLTYRQVYLTKVAYFVEKIHGELVEMTLNSR